MPRYSILKNVVACATITALPLALYATLAKARGVGVAHQTSIQTMAVGRATNPPQLKSLIYDGRIDNCDALNCGAVFINGESQRNNAGDSIPYTTEIYAAANECLRLEVTYQATQVQAQPAGMRIVLVSPTGSIWRNDGVIDNRPVITARTDVKGHYTVHINHSNDLQPRNSVQNFRLVYGRYVLGTPVNCPNPAVATFAELTK